MGLRVGVVTEAYVPSGGGGWTFSATLIEALRTVQSPHAFINLIHALQREESKDDARHTQEPSGLGLFRAVADKASTFVQKRFRRGGLGSADKTDRKQSPISSLEALARREKIDIVWFMTSMNEPLLLPFIATVWDLEQRNQPYFPEVSVTWTEREKVYSALLPRASLIITGTQAGKEQVVHYYRVNPANVMVIPFPVPADALMTQSLDAQGIRTKYKINGDFLFYPAQFWPHKNHVNLLRALRTLRDQNGLDLKLVFTGSEKGNFGHVEEVTADLNLVDQVFNLGFVSREDLNSLYKASTALVFPSYFGPDNLPPLEAFALGTPVIAANVAGAREQLGQAALLFDPSDPSDIAAKIEHLCRTPSLRAEMISKGKAIVAVCTPEAYIAALCSFLDRFEAIRRCWGVDYQLG
ncbi:MAG TPA: glycosyltransferase family 1 protein [Methylocella sp.]|nr:glycosyltransferase family 1 protein [Methylocella sp.]